MSSVTDDGAAGDPRAAVARLTDTGRVTLIGVRHHSPVLAAAIPALLEAAAPDAVLVELPADMQPWLTWLAHPDTQAPVALAAADGGEGGPLAFYPFADFSPELAALRWEGRSWHEEPAAALWREPIPDQAARWLKTLRLPRPERPAGHDLAFLDGVVTADQRGPLLRTPHLPEPVVVLAPHDDPVLPYVANLRLLAAHAAGLPVRMIGRFYGPRQVHGLAIAAPWLSDRFGGHVDLGIDHLQRADLPDAATTEPSGTDQPQPPLHLLAHHLQRVVAAGRAALVPDVDRDAQLLLDAQLPTAAFVLRELRRAGHRRSRDAFGRLNQQDSTSLAVAWLTAATYHHAATAAATAGSWQSRG
ncbi:DUF5682 family protein [Micromonospora sp. LAH09]|uniref:DUF5682 family protein n=1 Tax=Micromonospora cabrerizensis TaxID=2911213 RepID=UPI001EE805DE|nr:DUF5682 family protein [Micromonospora cabrerizensis]MCG5468920.1 DUF5682 family protein [Micromonospora cabrerizensis]